MLHSKLIVISWVVLLPIYRVAQILNTPLTGTIVRIHLFTHRHSHSLAIRVRTVT